MKSRRHLLVLFALALLLRLAPIDHGLPRGYVPDNHMVRSALGMAQDKDPVPPISKYSTYPYFVPYMLLPIYASQYALGRVTGQWGGSGEFAMRVKERPGLVQLPARILMAVFGAMTAWAVFRAARAAGLERGAYVACFLTATSLLNIHLSTHDRPWAAVVFFGAVAAWWSIEFHKSGRRRDLIVSGIAAALSFSCHQAGLGFLALPAFAWAFGPSGWRGADLKRRFLDGFACVALFALVAALVGHPYRLRYGATPAESIIGGGQHNTIDLGAQPLALGLSFESAQRLSVTMFGYDPALVVLGLVGLVLAFRFAALRATMSACVVIGLVALFNPSDHVRYLMPTCMLLALAAGLFVERAWSNQAARIGALALMALALVQAIRFDLVQRAEDTRNQFERELAKLPPGSLVAIDHYGPKPDLSKSALERVAALRTLTSREDLRRQYFEANVAPPTGPGLDVIQVEDLFGIDAESREYGPHDSPAVRALGATPQEVLRALGVTHLLLVERHPGLETRPLMPLVANARPLEVLDPSAESDDPCSEAFLPTEMDFPLTALWQVNRPGPRLSLFELAR